MKFFADFQNCLADHFDATETPIEDSYKKLILMDSILDRDYFLLRDILSTDPAADFEASIRRLESLAIPGGKGVPMVPTGTITGFNREEAIRGVTTEIMEITGMETMVMVVEVLEMVEMVVIMATLAKAVGRTVLRLATSAEKSVESFPSKNSRPSWTTARRTSLPKMLPSRTTMVTRIRASPIIPTITEAANPTSIIL